MASQRSHPSSTTRNGTPGSPKPAGRRRREDMSNSVHGDSKEAPLNHAGRVYEKILTYSTGTRYSIYIIPVALILMVPVIVSSTQVSSDPKKDPKIGGIRVVWFFTWIEAVWLSYWGMKFVARIIPLVFRYLAGVVSSETKKYARVLENLQQMITVLGWIIVSFVLYEVLFSTVSAGNTPLGWTKQFKEVLGAILVSTIIFAIEKTFVQLISVNYHARSFNNRISASKRAVFLLGLLFDASRTLFPMYGKDFLDEDYIIHSTIEAYVRKGRRGQIDPDTTSHGHHRRIFKGIGRVSNTANSVFGNIAAELTGKRVLQARSGQSMIIECLERTKASKALAQRLWYSFVMEGNDTLHLSDLEEVLGPDSNEVAEECFDMLDPDGNGDVSLDEISMKVEELSLERKAIARCMHDVSQAIKALDNVLSAVALLLSVFALISFLDTGFHSILTTASSTLISLSFIFSTTAAEFFGSCIFLFVKHPYDISDRVDIYGPDGINRLVVEEISLLYSSFRRITDMEVIQIPNNILNTLWINNISRAHSLIERLEVYISFDTSLEDIEALRLEMENFVTCSDNKRDFYPDAVFRCVGIGSMDKLQIQLEVRHKSNWSVETVRAARHSKLMCALVLGLRKVPIFGPGGGAAPLGDPTNPTYSVTVSDAVAAASREKAAKDADAARLHPANFSVPENKDNLAKSDSGNEALASILEGLTGEPLREQQRESDAFSVVGDQGLQSSAAKESQLTNGSSTSLGKSQSMQGRRKPSLTAPTRPSEVSREESNLANVPSQANSRNFDPEAQTSR
ncbi:uncharacterized protein LY89DRAFT_589788 [Mollisia scopiformis]|uniref:Mechanosensitive ion channel protein n=1 Tax=Mollisia scopiformis TaxID=149040 RepID=A0A194X3R4_MOLSC|nr:uncharacterized protein LY89DRAFT_589788 [Mollisia scopiformis]KUJ14457.1 hypothetical protein LY89DRAFT_589788 [Mollisia scopiformis]